MRDTLARIARFQELLARAPKFDELETSQYTMLHINRYLTPVVAMIAAFRSKGTLSEEEFNKFQDLIGKYDIILNPDAFYTNDDSEFTARIEDTVSQNFIRFGLLVDKEGSEEAPQLIGDLVIGTIQAAIDNGGADINLSMLRQAGKDIGRYISNPVVKNALAATSSEFVANVDEYKLFRALRKAITEFAVGQNTYNVIAPALKLARSPELSTLFPINKTSAYQSIEDSVKLTDFSANLTRIPWYKTHKRVPTARDLSEMKASSPADFVQFSALLSKVRASLKGDTASIIQSIGGATEKDLRLPYGELTSRLLQVRKDYLPFFPVGVPKNYIVDIESSLYNDKGEKFAFNGGSNPSIQVWQAVKYYFEGWKTNKVGATNPSVGAVDALKNPEKRADGTPKPGLVDQARIYLLKNTQAASENKLETVDSFIKNIDTFYAKLLKELKNPKSGDEKTLATLLSTVYFTAGRIGSQDKEGGGISKLRADQFKISNDSKIITMAYRGKKGINQLHTLKLIPELSDKEKPLLVATLKNLPVLIKAAEPDNFVFKHGQQDRIFTNQEINGFLRKLSGESKFTAHKFRHLRASLIFDAEAGKLPMFDPSSGGNATAFYTKQFNAVMELVGAQLGHMSKDKVTGKTALVSYLDGDRVRAFFSDRGVALPATVQTSLNQAEE